MSQLCVERRAFAPAAKEGEASSAFRAEALGALALGEEAVDAEGADGFERGLGHVGEERSEIGGEAGAEAALSEDGEEHVLAAFCGIGVAAEQAQDQRHGGRERRARGLGVTLPVRDRVLERREHVQRFARGAAGRDHAELGLFAETRELRLPEAPRGEPRASLLRERRRDFGAAARIPRARLHPRLDRLRAKARKREQQIRQIALHVDHQHRHARTQRLLHHHGEQPRLPAAGHAHHYAMRAQVMRRHVQGRGLASSIKGTRGSEE